MKHDMFHDMFETLTPDDSVSRYVCVLVRTTICFTIGLRRVPGHNSVYDMFVIAVSRYVHDMFTICLCISPDLDGYRGT